MAFDGLRNKQEADQGKREGKVFSGKAKKQYNKQSVQLEIKRAGNNMRGADIAGIGGNPAGAAFKASFYNFLLSVVRKNVESKIRRNTRGSDVITKSLVIAQRRDIKIVGIAKKMIAAGTRSDSIGADFNKRIGKEHCDKEHRIVVNSAGCAGPSADGKKVP